VCFGAGMRTRSAGVIFPRMSTIVGEHNDDPVSPSARVVAKSATQGAVIRFIKHQSSLVIGEPNDELLFFPVIADQFHRHGFDPKLLLSFQILSPKVFGLVELRCEENHLSLL